MVNFDSCAAVAPRVEHGEDDSCRGPSSSLRRRVWLESERRAGVRSQEGFLDGTLARIPVGPLNLGPWFVFRVKLWVPSAYGLMAARN